MNDWLLWQLVDSAFPTGAFAHSGGLEAAYQYGEVRSGPDLFSFIASSLHQLGHGTFPFLTTVHDQPERLDEVDRLCHVWTSNHVANRASRLQGRGLLAAAERAFDLFEARPNPLRLAHSHLAPVFGYVTVTLRISRLIMLRCFAFNHVRGLVAAAVRLNITGPFAGQRIQHQLADQAEAIVQRCQALTLEDLAQTSPLLDLWQASQDRLSSRLFQS